MTIVAPTRMMGTSADCREQWEIDFERDALERYRAMMRRDRPTEERAMEIREAGKRAGRIHV